MEQYVVVHALIMYYKHGGTVLTRRCVERVVSYAKCSVGAHAGVQHSALPLCAAQCDGVQICAAVEHTCLQKIGNTYPMHEKV